VHVENKKEKGSKNGVNPLNIFWALVLRAPHTHTHAWLGTSWLLIVGAIWPHLQQQSTNSPQQQICRVPECALYTQNRSCPFRRQRKELIFFLSFSLVHSNAQWCIDQITQQWWNFAGKKGPLSIAMHEATFTTKPLSNQAAFCWSMWRI